MSRGLETGKNIHLNGDINLWIQYVLTHPEDDFSEDAAGYTGCPRTAFFSRGGFICMHNQIETWLPDVLAAVADKVVYC